MGTRKGYRVTVTDRANNRRVVSFNISGMSLGKRKQNSVTKRKKSIRRKPPKRATAKRTTSSKPAKRVTVKRTASSKPKTERTQMVTNYGMKIG